MKRILILFALFIGIALAAPVSAGVPLDTVKTQVEGVLSILRDPSLKGDAGLKVKKERIRTTSQKMFDFVELSKRTLGQNWNTFSQEQRREFVDLYRALLEDAYVEKITAYTNEKVNFTKEVPLSENTVEVQSTVMAKTAEVPIYYRVIKRENDWKVYDVVIEGVSLIANYRSQFRDILANNQPEALLDTLRKKVGKR